MQKSDIKKAIEKKYLLEHMSAQDISDELKLPIEYVKKTLSKYTNNKSKFESKIGQILHSIYPRYKIIEQYPVGGLFVDYYIKDLRLAIEADGEQHSKMVSHWLGKTKIEQHFKFSHQANNDIAKDNMLKEQHIYVIRIKYDNKITEQDIRTILNEHRTKIVDNLNRFSAENWFRE